MGHAARAFFALRALFSLGLRPGLFFPPGILPPAGNFLLAQKVPQKRLPPVALRGLRLTRNPLGASLLRAHQRGSRDTVQNMEGVSSSFCGQPPAFSRRLHNVVGVPTLHCFLLARGLT